VSRQVNSAVRFYDNHPQPADFYAEVLHGLRRQPRYIPPKFFYDETGSQLFDAICQQPEYYPTRTEMQLLHTHAGEIAELIGSDCLLIEPGSGSSHKVRLLLDALQPAAYMPMDISRAHLLKAAQRLADDYPWLEVHATCIDFTTELELHFCPPNLHKVAFFPGSSVGNFEPREAITFLQRVAEMVGTGGGLLIGVDLKKDETILNAAYNDEKGMTARFNLNLLTRINRELEGDIEPDKFSHWAFYNSDSGRIEMHLVSQTDNRISVAGEKFLFRDGDSIHTENSYKYNPDEFVRLASQAGFESVAVWCDPDRLFSLHYFTAV
jgi:dimethylhistidine N-methyltransferase